MAEIMENDLKVVIAMAKDHGLSPLNYMVEGLGWEKEAAIQWLQRAAKSQMAFEIATNYNS